MKITENKNPISILIFILFVITGAIYFMQLHNLIVSSVSVEKGHSGLYILFTVWLLLGTALFMLSLITKVETIKVVEQKAVNENKTGISEKQTKLSDAENTNEDIDYDDLVNSILPHTDLTGNTAKYCEKLLSNLAKEFEIVQGVVFLADSKTELFNPTGKYAYFNEEPPKPFKTGETLPGQVARNKQMLIVDDIPEGYIKVVSGLGTSSPKHLMIIPVLNDDKVIGILEIASFKTFDDHKQTVMQKLSEKLKISFSSLIKE